MAEDEFDEFEEFGGEPNEHETELIQQDLDDLTHFEATFRPEGYRGMAIWCEDCGEEHYYPWDMLRENLQLLLETGEIPVHEPAFAPEPHRYIHWEYALGYVDALRDAGVDQRSGVPVCSRCGLAIPAELRSGNFCPRCGSPLLLDRLASVLQEAGVDEPTIVAVHQQLGLPYQPDR